MNELEKKKQIVKYSKLFEKNKLSPIRSGNISVRHKRNNIEGFLITPSGKKNIDLYKLRTKLGILWFSITANNNPIPVLKMTAKNVKNIVFEYITINLLSSNNFT